MRADRPELAREWVAEIEDFALATGTAWAAAAAEHGHGLLTDGRAAGSHFERALAGHSRSPTGVRPSQDRTGLKAVPCAGPAAGSTPVITSPPLADVPGPGSYPVGRPIRHRTCGRVRARPPAGASRDTTTDLTPQELRVARLVSQACPTGTSPPGYG